MPSYSVRRQRIKQFKEICPAASDNIATQVLEQCVRYLLLRYIWTHFVFHHSSYLLCSIHEGPLNILAHWYLLCICCYVLWLCYFLSIWWSLWRHGKWTKQSTTFIIIVIYIPSWNKAANQSWRSCGGNMRIKRIPPLCQKRGCFSFSRTAVCKWKS